MNSGPPFTLRDFVAYALPGAAFVAAVVMALRGDVTAELNPSVAQGFLLAAGTYVVGHALATVGGLVERLDRVTDPAAVAAVLGRPGSVDVRGGTSEASRPAGDMASDAPRRPAGRTPWTALPEVVASRVRQAAKLYGITQSREADLPPADAQGLRLIAEAVVREVHRADARLNRWGLLYDFCRNMAFNCVLGSLVLILGALAHRQPRDVGAVPASSTTHPHELLFAAAAYFVVAAVLTFRYFHFRRFYTQTLLTAFAEISFANAAGRGDDRTSTSTSPEPDASQPDESRADALSG